MISLQSSTPISGSVTLWNVTKGLDGRKASSPLKMGSGGGVGKIIIRKHLMGPLVENHVSTNEKAEEEEGQGSLPLISGEELGGGE